MGIFLGSAGIPGTVKRGNTIDGVIEVARLELNAMEIEFVRSVYMNEKTAKEVGEVAKENNVRLSVHAPYYINLCSKDAKIIKTDNTCAYIYIYGARLAESGYCVGLETERQRRVARPFEKTTDARKGFQVQILGLAYLYIFSMATADGVPIKGSLRWLRRTFN